MEWRSSGLPTACTAIAGMASCAVSKFSQTGQRTVDCSVVRIDTSGAAMRCGFCGAGVAETGVAGWWVGLTLCCCSGGRVWGCVRLGKTLGTATWGNIHSAFVLACTVTRVVYRGLTRLIEQIRCAAKSSIISDWAFFPSPAGCALSVGLKFGPVLHSCCSRIWSACLSRRLPLTTSA